MEIQVSKDFARNRVDFYLFERGPQFDVFFFYDENNNMLQQSIRHDELINQDVIKPILSLPGRVGEAFIQKVAEYAKNEGINVKEQSNNAGKLQAIEQHNQFLQTNLVKLIDFAIAGPGEKLKSI